ncbi:hypothetical protein HNY73_001668 [Argiope bruennichi]|uniref:Uncharacterized protein n=1 Tax=Argiope bruennichi TaxID=94029 RepID=A0A8T0FXQ4_ARGBR|nr:hypothetical protein HNY73_001668 [Argiope bruennichi]
MKLQNDAPFQIGRERQIRAQPLRLSRLNTPLPVVDAKNALKTFYISYGFTSNIFIPFLFNKKTFVRTSKVAWFSEFGIPNEASFRSKILSILRAVDKNCEE